MLHDVIDIGAPDLEWQLVFTVNYLQINIKLLDNYELL